MVPAITLGLAGTALLTAAAPRTLAAVRVWGGPTRVKGRASVRLECVRRAVGIDDHIALDGLSVRLGEVEVFADAARWRGSLKR